MIALHEAGELPERPDYVSKHGAWRKWYDEHVACAHCIMAREPGRTACKLCREAGKLSKRRRKPRSITGRITSDEPAMQNVKRKRRKPRRI